jgi:hypothetical protein
MVPHLFAMDPNCPRALAGVVKFHPAIVMGSFFIAPAPDSIVNHDTYVFRRLPIAANNSN